MRMELFMDLDHRTTILLPPHLHQRLHRIAARRGTSVGVLIREAIDEQFAAEDVQDRLDAVKALSELSLPVASVAEMKWESIATKKDDIPS